MAKKFLTDVVERDIDMDRLYVYIWNNAIYAEDVSDMIRYSDIKVVDWKTLKLVAYKIGKKFQPLNKKNIRIHGIMQTDNKIELNVTEKKGDSMPFKRRKISDSNTNNSSNKISNLPTADVFTMTSDQRKKYGFQLYFVNIYL
jgi:hypothetical protein